MGRHRVYADRADRQRAYRQRVDLTGDLNQLRADLEALAHDGRSITIEPALIDFTEANGRTVLRQLVKQIQERREAGR